MTVPSNRNIFFTPGGGGAKCNFWNNGYLQGLPFHILAYLLFTIPWNKEGVQFTRLWKKTYFSTLKWLKVAKKIKILKLYCTFTRHTYSYPRVSVVYSFEMMKFKWQTLYDRKCHWSTLIRPLGAKWKFRILTSHLQDMPNHILEYQLSTPENVDVVQVTNMT